MIGIFDSGLGGLTCLKEIRALLPTCDILYLGDVRYFPYGTKSSALVQERALWCGHFLQKAGAKAIVIACNTASACAGDLLKEKMHVLVVDVITPLIQALPQTAQKIGILATPTTLATRAYQREIEKALPHATVIARAAPELVEMVEEGRRDPEVVKESLRPLQGVDTLILGCTHFPHLKEMIAREIDAEIFDSATSCASHLNSLLADTAGSGKISYHVTAHSPNFEELAAQFLGASPLAPNSL